ncbi:hypothetical protein HanPI659440_Chr04g0153051 [Helianthus annuus]|nr:hypothetical protein HanPI659440_Chr04g0153051 [Helianthus annuus]
MLKQKTFTSVWGGLCPVCGFDPESADHLLVRCTVTKRAWWWICVWLKVPIPSVLTK